MESTTPASEGPRHGPLTGRLPTGCAALDDLLDGGLERDAVTLAFGEGGSGKTNLALQCAREAAAAGLRVAFVDTEGVSADRMHQVFAGAPEGALDRLLFFTPFDFPEQERLVQRSTLVKGLGLVVVDSINMHYRLHLDGGEEAERVASRSLYKQLHHLTGFARRHQVPVLVTGQVFGIEDSTQPFARRTMEHLVKASVRLEKRQEAVRRATVVKHRSIPEGRQALFRIGAHGLEPLGGAPEQGVPTSRTAPPLPRAPTDRTPDEDPIGPTPDLPAPDGVPHDRTDTGGTQEAEGRAFPHVPAEAPSAPDVEALPWSEDDPAPGPKDPENPAVDPRDQYEAPSGLREARSEPLAPRPDPGPPAAGEVPDDLPSLPHQERDPEEEEIPLHDPPADFATADTLGTKEQEDEGPPGRARSGPLPKSP